LIDFETAIKRKEWNADKMHDLIKILT